jgi:hypothetical protein
MPRLAFNRKDLGRIGWKKRHPAQYRRFEVREARTATSTHQLQTEKQP